jgi:shikimate dehydrogenase
MRRFGLIGYPLSHSFSEGYFAKKFSDEKITDAIYQNFPLATINQFPDLIQTHPDFCGLNVTIPYKSAIIPFLNKLDDTAREVHAVNTIKFERDENKNILLVGYNTDVYGFEQTIAPLLLNSHRTALILGTGGSSKAVKYVFGKLGLSCSFVSRKPGIHVYKTYEELTPEDIEDFLVIVNTTPTGMFPNVDAFPLIPYEKISDKHVLFDLIYNPTETLFLRKGKQQGARVCNGLQMLHLQADKAWSIWNSI